MIKLLLVEDDASLCYMVKSSLEDLIGGYVNPAKRKAMVVKNEK